MPATPIGVIARTFRPLGRGRRPLKGGQVKFNVSRKLLRALVAQGRLLITPGAEIALLLPHDIG